MALRRRAQRGSHELFAGFTDVSEIGVGSLAVVFRAREIGTNRHVALKLLNVRDASERSIESFERESIALGALSSHPNIVTLYRTFRIEDGRPVLVLELCSGAVADRLQGGGGLPVTDAVSIGIKIAGALETAHRGGILHRDVKPQNILVTEFGEPALADFGVAMLQSSTQTTAGLFDFTTLHAAPELLEGGGTSAATDVYELASSLYQLIAGQSAFRAYEGESPASVILRILRDPVRPLSGVDVPMALSDLLIRAMSKEKDERPPTAAEFAAELADVEIAQGWNRTQFLIRDPGPLGTGISPAVTRMPDTVPRGLPSMLATPGPRSYLTPAQQPPTHPVGPPAPSPRPAVAATYAAPPTPPRRMPPSAPPAAPRAPDSSVAIWSAPTIVSTGGWTPPPPPPPPPPRARPSAVPPTGAEPAPPSQPIPDPAPASALVPPAESGAAPSPANDGWWSAPPAGVRPAARTAPPQQLHPVDWSGYAAPEQLPSTEPISEIAAESTDEGAHVEAATVPTDAPADALPPGRRVPAAEVVAPAQPALPAEPGAVPIWAVRAPAPVESAAMGSPRFSSDLSLDPMSLRPKATLRAGASAVIVDDQRLRLRTWFKRTSIPWSDVLGFEAHLDTADDDAPAASGYIVALTALGPLAMPGTRRALGELRYVHALLDAYRIRAQRIASR